MNPDARDPIADLQQLWQSVQAPAPHRDELESEDVATQAAVAWMRAAAQVAVPPAPDALRERLHQGARPQPFVQRTHWWSGLAAAALLAILFGLWQNHQVEPSIPGQQDIAMGPRDDPDHSETPPLSPDSLPRGIPAQHLGNSIEMRSGNVRLSFITQKPETL